jgi:hypothetical protein
MVPKKVYQDNHVYTDIQDEGMSCWSRRPNLQGLPYPTDSESLVSLYLDALSNAESV